MLRWVAFGIALSVQIGMVVTYGMITDWCFCSCPGDPDPAVPPPFVMRFLELSVLPTALLRKGLAVPVLFVLNLEAWFLAVLALLHALVLAARIRFGPVRVGTTHMRRVWLAPHQAVRPIHLAVLAGLLMGAAMLGGALYRRAWLSEAEQVFTATMAAANAERPLPPGVEFSMWEWRGDDLVDVKPEASFAIKVDPRESGERFLDRFVAPYTYGGRVRFESGRVFYFAVYRTENGWGVLVDRSRRRERW